MARLQGRRLCASTFTCVWILHWMAAWSARDDVDSTDALVSGGGIDTKPIRKTHRKHMVSSDCQCKVYTKDDEEIAAYQRLCKIAAIVVDEWCPTFGQLIRNEFLRSEAKQMQMSSIHRLILGFYTSQAYKDINKWTATNDMNTATKDEPWDRAMSEVVNLLADALRAQRGKNPLPPGTNLWRGVSSRNCAARKDEYAIGKTKHFSRFKSTSIDKVLAETFAGCLLLKITNQPAEAVEISGLSLSPLEKEYLIPPGAEFNVTDNEEVEIGDKKYLLVTGKVFSGSEDDVAPDDEDEERLAARKGLSSTEDVATPDDEDEQTGARN